MAREVIEYVLRTVDESSEALEEVSESADEAGEALDEASKGTKGLSESFAAMKGPALAAAAAAAAVGAALFALAKSTADYINQINDASVRTGFASNTLLGLSSAAKSTGLEFSTMEPVLAAFVMKATQAAAGTGEAAGALERLDVSVTDSAGGLRAMDDLLRETIDALVQIEDPTQRSSEAIQIFGARGLVMLQALSDGSATIDEWTEKAHLAGVVVEGEAAVAAAAWQVEVAELDIAMKGLKQTLGEGLIPEIVALSETFRVILSYKDVFKDSLGFLIDHNVILMGIKGLGSIIEAEYRVIARVLDDMTGKAESLLQLVGLAEGGGASGGAGAGSTWDAPTPPAGPVSDDGGGGGGGGAPVAIDLEGLDLSASGFGTELPEAIAAVFVDSMPTITAEMAAGMDVAGAFAAVDAADQAARRDKLKGVATSVAGAGAGLLQGDTAPMLAALGPAGMGLGMLGNIGDAGAGGVRDNLSSMTDAFVGGLEALPEILGEVLPDFVGDLVEGLITGLIENGPAIFMSLLELLIQLPVIIGAAILDALGLGEDSAFRTGLRAIRDLVIEGAMSTQDASVETATFGDTPGIVRAGAGGLLASFAPGDLVVASRTPAGLSSQVAGGGGGLSGGGVSITINADIVDPDAISRLVDRLKVELGVLGSRAGVSLAGGF